MIKIRHAWVTRHEGLFVLIYVAVATLTSWAVYALGY